MPEENRGPGSKKFENRWPIATVDCNFTRLSLIAVLAGRPFSGVNILQGNATTRLRYSRIIINLYNVANLIMNMSEKHAENCAIFGKVRCNSV